ncbi:hypothetical protein ACH4TQ_50995, partial [Streptomyces sp. NPDC021218]|uniref:NucA/NucB deoxyribonuclease domain-containing protein n=1 Tax=Streptomyces sp. NPDC021218 TaxID=3365119 RepID=UPI00379CA6BC
IPPAHTQPRMKNPPLELQTITPEADRWIEAKEGGTNQSPPNRAIKWVPRWENNTQGTILSSHYKNYRVLNGDPYYVAA